MKYVAFDSATRIPIGDTEDRDYDRCLGKLRKIYRGALYHNFNEVDGEEINIHYISGSGNFYIKKYNMKRLLIENDQLDTETCNYILGVLEDLGVDDDKINMNYFNVKIEEAMWDNREAVLKAIEECDEIYAYTSLVDNMGIHGGTLFNGLMHHAIEKNVTGKKVFLFSDYKSIWWENLRKELVDKAFRKNHLYVLEYGEKYQKHWITRGTNGAIWDQVDIDKLIKEKL